jgi:hypothetical protein
MRVKVQIDAGDIGERQAEPFRSGCSSAKKSPAPCSRSYGRSKLTASWYAWWLMNLSGLTALLQITPSAAS